MAKIYNSKEHEIYWSSSDVLCPVEDALWELRDIINAKRMDGHMRMDQWYMKVELRLNDLLDALIECPRVEDLENEHILS